MKAIPHMPVASSSARRDALIALCARQREELATEARDLVLPLTPAYLRGRFGSKMKWPLMLAGGALGLFITRPRRITRALLAATTLARSVGTIVPLLRNIFPEKKRPRRMG